jgi:hypothetical protein
MIRILGGRIIGASKVRDRKEWHGNGIAWQWEGRFVRQLADLRAPVPPGIANPALSAVTGVTQASSLFG